MEEINKNPADGFSDREIIKKFHWLQENGMTTDQAAQTIRELLCDKYNDHYLGSLRQTK